MKELQKQVKDLQDDLEENSDADENGKRISDSKNIGPENLNEQEEAQNRETDRISDNSKTQQMEVHFCFLCVELEVKFEI